MVLIVVIQKKPPTTQVKCENENVPLEKTCDEDIDCAGNMVCKKDDGKKKIRKFGKCPPT